MNSPSSDPSHNKPLQEPPKQDAFCAHHRDLGSVAKMTDSSLFGALKNLCIDGRRAPRPFEHTNYKSQLAITKSPPQSSQDRPFKTLAPTTTSSLSCAPSSQFATASSIGSNSNSSSAVLRAHRAAALNASSHAPPAPSSSASSSASLATATTVALISCSRTPRI